MPQQKLKNFLLKIYDTHPVCVRRVEAFPPTRILVSKIHGGHMEKFTMTVIIFFSHKADKVEIGSQRN